MKIWKLQGNLILITSSFFLILPLKLYSQDIIYCIDGRVMKSIIKKIEGDNITYSYFTDKNNVPYKISKREITGIIYHDSISVMYNNLYTEKLKDLLKGKLMPNEAEMQIIKKHNVPGIETRKINLSLETNYSRILKYKKFEENNFLKLEMQGDVIKETHLTLEGEKLALNGIQIDKAYGNPYIEVKVGDLEFDKILEIVERPDTNVAMVQLNLLRKNITKSGEIFEIINGEFTIYEYFVKSNGDWKIINKEIKTQQREVPKKINNHVLKTHQNSNNNFKDKSEDRDKIIDVRKKEVIGKLLYNDGKIYEGELLNGHKHGEGKITTVDGTTFEGRWRNDTMVGNATIIIPNKSKYSGEVKLNGIKNGNGTITFNDSSTFVGQFLNDNFYNGKLTDKKQKGYWVLYTGEFKDNQLYHGTIATIILNCPKCDVIIAEFNNGNKGQDIAYKLNEYEKHLTIRKTEVKYKPIKKNRVEFGLAFSAGRDYAKISGADADLKDSTSFGYSPSIFMSVQTSKASLIELSVHYTSKQFRFYNSGNNYEYNFENQYSYNTNNAKLQFQEVGVSAKFKFSYIFIEGFINKIISAKRTGGIFCLDKLGVNDRISDKYKYDFFSLKDYPVISGQRPMNEYIYGISGGLEIRGDNVLLGMGYSLNLSNYFNNKYQLWSEDNNIDFYPTKEINLKLGYLYLKMGYIF